MRGYIYEVSEVTEGLGSMSESNFYERTGELGAGYVSDTDKAQAKREISNTINLLVSNGAKEVEEDGFQGVILFQETKRKYFQDRYAKLNELVKGLSLDDFATSDMYGIRKVIEDTYGDAVYDSRYDESSTFDDWVRKAETGVPYYFGNVVLMN